MLEERIADVAVELWEEDISPQTQHLLKRNLVDSYAGICASLLDGDLIVTLKNFAGLVPDEKGVFVWGTARRAQPLQAVFLNAILGRRSDLVNTYLSPSHMGGNHPSDNVSLILTLTDWKKTGGKGLIRTMHAAYMLSCAFSDYYNPEASGYDHDAAASLYTSLICGLFEGLDVVGLVEAQRIAGAMGLDPDQTGLGVVTDWKHCTYASCAMRGASAALMAKAGFKGPVDIYQGKAGWNRFIPHAESFMSRPPDLSTIIFKSWQALVFCQTAIDVAAKLSPRFLAYDWNQVEAIIVDTYQKAIEEAGGEGCYQPSSRAGRTHSLPYCVAAALIDGGVNYDSFSEQRAVDEKIKALIRKVTLRADKEMTASFPAKAPCRISIECRGRSPLTASQEYPHGDPHDPLTEEEITNKAKGHLSKLVPEDKASVILERLWNIENEADLAWLLGPLYQGVNNG